ncbi:hypothetical protein [Pseudarthrobacter sp. MM222]|uniref:hypothetical protein n=1 Tax=Pseudarthrobacter sp. MM222 TaxID=3018929 RepID=UPI0024C5AB0B|nr:hypothetical protein NKCBBBOE_02124 [Pseudarthrobacter sp. MM222]
MSPVNSDDSPGDAFGASGRPLTRKEIRAREKSLMTQGHEVIPPQAFETGQDSPTAPAPAPADAAPAPAPAPAEAAPPVHAPQPPAARPTVHEDTESQETVPADSAARDSAPEDAAFRHAPREYAGSVIPGSGPHYETGLQPGYAAHPGADYSGYEAHPHDSDDPYGDDSDRYPDYSDAEAGHEVLAGASAKRSGKGLSKKSAAGAVSWLWC